MKKSKTAKTSRNPAPSQREKECLLNDPLKAAQHLDALIRMVQRKYGDTSSSVANLGSFLVSESEVVFSRNVEHVRIAKRPQSQILQILAPVVSSELEEQRRAELLLIYSPLLLKFQREGYLQVREMLLKILDEDGRKTLVDELENYVSQLEKSGRLS